MLTLRGQLSRLAYLGPSRGRTNKTSTTHHTTAPAPPRMGRLFSPYRRTSFLSPENVVHCQSRYAQQSLSPVNSFTAVPRLFARRTQIYFIKLMNKNHQIWGCGSLYGDMAEKIGPFWGRAGVVVWVVDCFFVRPRHGPR